MRHFATVAIAGIAFVAAPLVAQDAAANPARMSAKEIAAHNAVRQRTDPDFINCKRFTVTGTLAKKVRVCKTNDQWAALSTRSREWTQTTQDGLLVSPGPPGN